MVGFDGQGGYANCVKVPEPVGGGQHDRIKADSIRLLDKLEIAAEFVSPTNPAGGTAPEIDYGQLYDELRSHGYHEEDDQSTHLAPFAKWIATKLQPSTALDVGCSTGKSVEVLRSLGIEATGVEISSIAVAHGQTLGRNVVCGNAVELPFGDNSFDLVCSADVFEHLSPQDGRRACEEACRVARRFVFLKIAEKQDVTQKWKDISRQPLHLTTEPIDWWKQWLKPFGSIIRIEPELVCLAISHT